MSDVNQITLLGNMTADPERIPTQTDTVMCSLRMATGRYRSDTKDTETTFHRIVVMGKRAETILNHLKKGSRVFVQGSLQIRKYTDKNGVDKWSADVLVSPYDGKVEFQPRNTGAGANQRSTEQQAPPPPLPQDFDDEIPF